MPDTKDSYGLFEKMLSINVDLFILNRFILNRVASCSAHSINLIGTCAAEDCSGVVSFFEF